MARKGWENLSRDRRRKLEKRGVTRELYNSGAPLGERSYETRRTEAMRRYGITPSQLRRIRRENPDLARESDRLRRKAKRSPQEAQAEGKDFFYNTDDEVRYITVNEVDGETAVNPLLWYHYTPKG